MKRTFRNLMIIMLVVLMLLGILGPIFADNTADFEANPGKYQEKCRGVIASDDKEICSEYKQYLIDKAAANQSNKDQIENDLAALRQDIVANFSKLRGFENQIKEIEAVIAGLDEEIALKEEEIARLEEEIQKREVVIKEIEDKVKSYMVNSQSSMRVNGYIEFVMGANDFADIVRRIEGMNSIKRYNESLIEELRLEREALEKDKESIVSTKEEIEQNKALQVVEKENVDILREATQLAYEELQRQKVSLEVQSAEIQEQIDYDQSIANSIISGGRIINPVPTGWKTESVWDYRPQYGGGVHLGTDLAAGYFEPIYAMGNGIVVVASGGCDTYSSWGCNNGLGNHMATIVQTNEGVFGTLIMHMASGSFRVGRGDYIQAGQQVAAVGNSGNSLGSHAHVEIFNLGVSSVQEGLEKWNSSWRDAQFGLGGSGGKYSSLCSNRGAPCRLNPESYLGV